MNRSRLAFLVLSIALVVPVLSSTFYGAAAYSVAAKDEGEEDSLYKYLSVFTEVLRLVRSVYVQETDIRTLMAGALDGAVDALDPFSVFVPADQIEAYRKARLLGRSRSGLLVLKERGVVYVAAVDEGGPAAGAGVKPGDLISKIGGLSSRVMPLWQVQGLLTGEPDTQLELELIRRGSTLAVTLGLAEWSPAMPSLKEQRGISVLRVPTLSVESAAQLERLLDGKAERILLVDLRGVAGGDAEAAYRMAEHFAAGELGALVRGEQQLRHFASPPAARWSGRLAVLLDRGSQGAAEILAAVLKQRAGAQLLGEPSFGHAGEATLVKLKSGAYLDLTEAFYTGPDHKPLSEGLEPDLPIELGYLDEDQAGGDGDPVLERALELLLDGANEGDGERDVA